jgi:hypothetical protein
MRATVGPRLGSAFVERHLAIVDALLVLPLLAEPFLAGELRGPIGRRGRTRTLIGVGRSRRLVTGAGRSQRHSRQNDCERPFRNEACESNGNIHAASRPRGNGVAVLCHDPPSALQFSSHVVGGIALGILDNAAQQEQRSAPKRGENLPFGTSLVSPMPAVLMHSCC